MPDREYFNERRKNRRVKFLDLLGGKCERCGSKDDLHFDHKRPKKKEFRIADRIDAPEDILLKEVMKCILMCASCHRDKTREKGEHGQPKSRHGTLHRYKSYGCRCKKCKETMSEYNKEKRMNAAKLIEMVDSFVKLADEESELHQAIELMADIANQTHSEDRISNRMIFAMLDDLRDKLTEEKYPEAFDILRKLGKFADEGAHKTIIELAIKIAAMRDAVGSV